MGLKLQHWMKKEGKSGLVMSTLELAEAEEKQGHTVLMRQPGEDAPIYISKGGIGAEPDIHLIHSQLAIRTYHDGKLLEIVSALR